MQHKKVDICVATFRRPELLSRLLISILRQKSLPAPNELQIIVIDNDIHGSAQKEVESFAGKCIYKVIYDIEPIQNIALARNRALRYLNGEYALFVDDDEYVSESWLQNMLQCAARFEADVVFGPVSPVLPTSASEWIRNGRFFDRKRYLTGTLRDRGGTGNTLVRTEILMNDEVSFDQGFGRTGGSDTKLFFDLSRKGCKLVWCDEAEVFEHVAENRMTIKWILLRAFRGGQVYARIFLVHQPFLKKSLWCLSRCVFLIMALTLMPFGWLKARYLGIKALQKIYAYSGQLSAMLGLKQYEEYRHK